MRLGRFAAPVGEVKISNGRRITSAEWQVVAHIGPQSPGARLALGEHRHGGVISVQACGRKDMRADELCQRLKCGGARPDPVGHRGDFEGDALMMEGARLPR